MSQLQQEAPSMPLVYHKTQVQKTKKPIRVTRFGKPIAEVIPPSPTPRKDWMGSMKSRIEILGDIVSPANEESDWEALRD